MTKRGSHLALSLGAPGCPHQKNKAESRNASASSATVKPIDQVAEFLSPNAPHRQPWATAARWKLRSKSRAMNSVPVASNEMWAEIYDRVAELILAHRTTPGLREHPPPGGNAWPHALEERLGPNLVLPHHGSLSPRSSLERRGSLEKWRAARGSGNCFAGARHRYRFSGNSCARSDRLAPSPSPLQRIGRSGTLGWREAQGSNLLPRTRDELIECAALVRSIRSGGLDVAGDS